MTLPKPLVEIGAMPMLWHIMKIYAAHGLNDFVICCGYKGHLIKKYFLDFFHREGDLTIDLPTNAIEVNRVASEPWRVTLADTGLETMTGGRLKRVRDYLGDETFCLTYGDGVSDIDIARADRLPPRPGRARHRDRRAAARPLRRARLLRRRQAGRRLPREERRRRPPDQRRLLRLRAGGDRLVEGDATVWEEEPLKALVARGELAVYHHKGFWQNMDTLRDKHVLQEMWDSGQRALEGLGPRRGRPPGGRDSE